MIFLDDRLNFVKQKTNTVLGLCSLDPVMEKFKKSCVVLFFKKKIYFGKIEGFDEIHNPEKLYLSTCYGGRIKCASKRENIKLSIFENSTIIQLRDRDSGRYRMNCKEFTLEVRYCHFQALQGNFFSSLFVFFNFS